MDTNESSSEKPAPLPEEDHLPKPEPTADFGMAEDIVQAEDQLQPIDATPWFDRRSVLVGIGYAAVTAASFAVLKLVEHAYRARGK